ncbi:hypothetical protein ACK8P5_25955 (plasmid) [Paenibacillus sp. EC2-1]|uniref:hypothetical protein n=1 Tax=Paenibacillus sp. EC2-1 TaxID=3388665 RepID=UPI003BEF388C
MSVKNGQQRTNDENDDRVVIDIDDDADLQDIEAEDIEDDMMNMISSIVQQQLNENNVKIDERFNSMQTQLDKMDSRIQVLEKASAKMGPSATKAQNVRGERNMVDSALDMTFGTAGKILHGALDTLSYVTSTFIDLATLGRAKDKPIIHIKPTK